MCFISNYGFALKQRGSFSFCASSIINCSPCQKGPSPNSRWHLIFKSSNSSLRNWKNRNRSSYRLLVFAIKLWWRPSSGHTKRPNSRYSSSAGPVLWSLEQIGRRCCRWVGLHKVQSWNRLKLYYTLSLVLHSLRTLVIQPFMYGSLTHASIHPSIHPSIHTPNYPSIHLSNISKIQLVVYYQLSEFRLVELLLGYML